MKGDVAGTFDGFPQGVGLLTEIGRSTKQEFARIKDRWQEEILGPTRCFVEELGTTLRATISPTLCAVPKVNGSIAPITRDLRFSPDRDHPYKDHVLLNFWDGEPKRSSATIRLRLGTDMVGFAAGSAFGADGLLKWRQALCARRGQELVEALDELERLHDLSFSTPELKGVPNGFAPAGTKSTELIRHKSFQVRFLEPTPPLLTTPQFVDWVAERFGELGTIHNWLVEHTQ